MRLLARLLIAIALAATARAGRAQALQVPAGVVSLRAPAAAPSPVPRLPAPRSDCTRSTLGQRFGAALAIGVVGATLGGVTTHDSRLGLAAYVAGSAGGAMLAGHYCHEPVRPVLATIGAIAGVTPLALVVADERDEYQDGPSGQLLLSTLIAIIGVPLGAAAGQGLARERW